MGSVVFASSRSVGDIVVVNADNRFWAADMWILELQKCLILQ